MRILLLGESWNVIQVNIMGYNHVISSRAEEPAVKFIGMLKELGYEADHLSNQKAVTEFPRTIEELRKYDVLILSDIGSDTLLLHPDVQFKCQRKINILNLICKYVAQGGGFLMCGGYMSFSGIEGKARYAMTPIAEILPVELLHYDDRVEHPEGIVPQVVKPEHPILNGIDTEWPDFLGYNKLKIKNEAELIATMAEKDAFIAAMNYQKGRSIAFASDCMPHWGTPEFVGWKHYKTLFKNMMLWLKKEI